MMFATLKSHWQKMPQGLQIGHFVPVQCCHTGPSAKCKPSLGRLSICAVWSGHGEGLIHWPVLGILSHQESYIYDDTQAHLTKMVMGTFVIWARTLGLVFQIHRKEQGCPDPQG